MLFQILKGLPWWFWVLIIISFIFGGTQNRRRRHNYYNNESDKAPMDIIADNIISYIVSLFKSKNRIGHIQTINHIPNNISNIKSNISYIDHMSGRDFEKYLEQLFIRLGYSVNRVGTSWYDHRGDFGADLIVEKEGVKTAIQAKCYSNYVGINSIREVLGAVNYYQCQKAMVVTNSYFTSDAQTQAKVSNVELWNRDELLKVIKN